MDEDREALLGAAENLFYERGVQSVGMDRIRDASGLSLKRIYAICPTKSDLVVAVLRRRDERWRGRLVASVEVRRPGIDRVLAVFDWLYEWSQESDFRGCAWVNVHGELGGTSPEVVDEVRKHKAAFRQHLAEWVDGVAGLEADDVHLLAEGAIVTAGVMSDPALVLKAKDACRRLATLS
ncbi:TetR/AcrR family transcriptional regulator [Microbacterium suaedae]|uniref:TetR/AcrR family transcriptional regulator n=1 Tax=Microbacterium suaedae TaxID=2067813 RepID=UPI000DA224E2|nr:TetR family transcriptional regulator [Microbacterium suaedae]